VCWRDIWSSEHVADIVSTVAELYISCTQGAEATCHAIRSWVPSDSTRSVVSAITSCLIHGSNKTLVSEYSCLLLVKRVAEVHKFAKN